MPTNTRGTTARNNMSQNVQTISGVVKFSAGASAEVVIGTLPAGAIVVGGGVLVTTVFNAGTNNNIDVGTKADPDGFATALAMTAKGLKAFDELATSDDLQMTTDTVITATLGLTGTAATTGEATVIVQFIAANG